MQSNLQVEVAEMLEGENYSVLTELAHFAGEKDRLHHWGRSGHLEHCEDRWQTLGDLAGLEQRSVLLRCDVGSD